MSKAIKIHRANEKLQSELKDCKERVDRLKREKESLEQEVQELQMRTNQQESRDLHQKEASVNQVH